MPKRPSAIKNPANRDPGAEPWTDSGNPKGRKKGMSFAEIMARELERPWDKDALKRQETALRRPTNKERIVATFVARAAAGDYQAFVELMNRTEGKVPDQLMAQVEHAVKVVPWDDDTRDGYVYVEDQQTGDRGLGVRMEEKRPLDVPALPDMYPPLTEQTPGLDQRVREAEDAEAAEYFASKADDRNGSAPA